MDLYFSGVGSGGVEVERFAVRIRMRKSMKIGGGMSNKWAKMGGWVVNG